MFNLTGIRTINGERAHSSLDVCLISIEVCSSLLGYLRQGPPLSCFRKQWTLHEIAFHDFQRMHYP
jgi:hypothetical protein